PDGAFDDEQRCVGGMPPALRNNRTPPTGEIPASTAACSLERPTAIEAQNCRRFSRQARFHNFIATSLAKVLRRPVESAQYSRGHGRIHEKAWNTGCSGQAG